MQSRVGQQFGNYRLTALIGVGGYADVYLAEHAYITGIQHAIKVLKGTDLEEYNQDEFQREARTIASLQRLSPYIVRISDVGVQAIEEGGATSYVPYIVMEYAPCGTLRSLYPHGTQAPLERIIFYTKQIAEALQCAHDQNIIHRDVKPENMLLRTMDHVLLSDFGISISGKTGLLTPPKEKVAGTAAYIAPERFSSYMRRASDQYSLGVVVYEWISGACPFDGTDEEILAKHVTMPPPPLYSTYAHVTRELSEVVAHTLEKKPDDRYPTVQAFAYALERAVALTTRMPPALAQPLQQGQSIVPVSVSQTLPAPISNVEATASAPAVPAVPPVDQKDQWPKITAPVYVSDTTQAVGPQQTLSTQNVAANPVRQSLRKERNVFELSSQFASDPRYEFFIYTGIVLNACSAIILSFLLRNTFVLLGGLIVSWSLFTLCIYAIEEKLALFFGMLLALYWAYVGYVIGQALASLLKLKTLPPALFIGGVFLLASMGLHIWYVSHKNL